jgi:hypothetical protein
MLRNPLLVFALISLSLAPCSCASPSSGSVTYEIGGITSGPSRIAVDLQSGVVARSGPPTVAARQADIIPMAVLETKQLQGAALTHVRQSAAVLLRGENRSSNCNYLMADYLASLHVSINGRSGGVSGSGTCLGPIAQTLTKQLSCAFESKFADCATMEAAPQPVSGAQRLSDPLLAFLTTPIVTRGGPTPPLNPPVPAGKLAVILRNGDLCFTTSSEYPGKMILISEANVATASGRPIQTAKMLLFLYSNQRLCRGFAEFFGAPAIAVLKPGSYRITLTTDPFGQLRAPARAEATIRVAFDRNGNFILRSTS